MDDNPATFVVGIDGSDHSLIALTRAIGEARAHDAQLRVVHVAEAVTGAVLHLPDEVSVSTTELADARRDEVWAHAEQTLQAADVPIERVNLEGRPSEAIVEYCSDVASSLLIVGTRGRGRLASALLGSTATAAIQHAPCDVLVARPPTATEQ